MRSDTSSFISELVSSVNSAKDNFVCYYDRAPNDDDEEYEVVFPYGVVGKIHPTSLDEGFLITFDLDLWTDDKLPTATEDLEQLCDDLQNYLDHRIISREGEFYGHIGYEGRDTSDDRDTDISHRRMYFAARVFYI